MSSQISRQIIKENYKNPNNAYQPDKYTHTHELKNLSCGDEINVYLNLDEQTKEIKSIHFEAQACALTIATASLLTQELSGKSLDEIDKLDVNYLNDLLDTELSMNRVKCSLLPLRAIQQALELRPPEERF